MHVRRGLLVSTHSEPTTGRWHKKQLLYNISNESTQTFIAEHVHVCVCMHVLCTFACVHAYMCVSVCAHVHVCMHGTKSIPIMLVEDVCRMWLDHL